MCPQLHEGGAERINWLTDGLPSAIRQSAILISPAIARDLARGRWVSLGICGHENSLGLRMEAAGCLWASAAMKTHLDSVWRPHVAASRFYRGQSLVSHFRSRLLLGSRLSLWLSGRRPSVVARPDVSTKSPGPDPRARFRHNGALWHPTARRSVRRAPQNTALVQQPMALDQAFAGKCAKQNGDFPLFRAAIITTGRQGVGPPLLLFVPAKIRYFSVILSGLGEAEWVGEDTGALGLTMALGGHLPFVCLHLGVPLSPPGGHSSTLSVSIGLYTPSQQGVLLRYSRLESSLIRGRSEAENPRGRRRTRRL